MSNPPSDDQEHEPRKPMTRDEILGSLTEIRESLLRLSGNQHVARRYGGVVLDSEADAVLKRIFDEIGDVCRRTLDANP